MKENNLTKGYILQGADYSYRIESVLGQGSFGVTYLATTKIEVVGKLGNIETEIKVAIKEFFMKEFSNRHEDGSITEMTGGSLVHSYAIKFRKEAENLAKLSHPNIVNVLEVFEANNTCYYAMQYLAGGSLDAYVKSRGGLPEAEAVACIRQIGEAVQYMHDHRMLHLDLKPGNVMRSEDGQKMVLIDFGLSKQYGKDGNPESSTTIGLGTAGYAPIEQSKSDRDKEFAPTLDVYALGATFFKLLTATTPPDSSDVLNEGLPIDLLEGRGVSRKSIAAIERAMEPRKPKRVQSVAEFLGLLPAQSADEITRIADEQPMQEKNVEAGQQKPSNQFSYEKPEHQKKRRKWEVMSLVLVQSLIYYILLQLELNPSWYFDSSGYNMNQLALDYFTVTSQVHEAVKYFDEYESMFLFTFSSVVYTNVACRLRRKHGFGSKSFNIGFMLWYLAYCLIWCCCNYLYFDHLWGDFFDFFLAPFLLLLIMFLYAKYQRIKAK